MFGHRPIAPGARAGAGKTAHGRDPIAVVYGDVPVGDIAQPVRSDVFLADEERVACPVLDRTKTSQQLRMDIIVPVW